MPARAVRWWRWIPVLLVCAACALPAARASATTTTTTPSQPPLEVSLLPCNPPSAGAPCRVEPTEIQADLPSGDTGLQVEWVTTSQTAPAPSPTSVVLTTQAGPESPTTCPGSSGANAKCWYWPAALRYQTSGWILNGTYRFTPCSAVKSTSNPGTACETTDTTNASPATLQIAVPPNPPANVAATQTNGAVTVSWSAGPEPDLVGYTVTRNNLTVYRCSTEAAGPGAGTPCANPPSFSDQPGYGTWTYAVSATRFGADSSASDYVTSPAALASPYSLTVSPPPPAASSPGPGATTFSSGPSGRAALPALPPMGILRPAQLTPSGGVAATAVPSIADTEDSGGTATGTPSALPYNDNPALNGTLASGTAQRQQKPKGSIDPAAELALAILALALAVHVWYVRGELRVASVRVAARRAAGEAAG